MLDTLTEEVEPKISPEPVGFLGCINNPKLLALKCLFSFWSSPPLSSLSFSSSGSLTASSVVVLNAVNIVSLAL